MLDNGVERSEFDISKTDILKTNSYNQSELSNIFF